MEYLEAAKIDQRLNLPNGRAARMARAGQIPALILPDGTIRIPKEEFEQWLNSCRNTGTRTRSATPAPPQR